MSVKLYSTGPATKRGFRGQGLLGCHYPSPEEPHSFCSSVAAASAAIFNDWEPFFFSFVEPHFWLKRKWWLRALKGSVEVVTSSKALFSCPPTSDPRSLLLDFRQFWTFAWLAHLVRGRKPLLKNPFGYTNASIHYTSLLPQLCPHGA